MSKTTNHPHLERAAKRYALLTGTLCALVVPIGLLLPAIADAELTLSSAESPATVVGILPDAAPASGAERTPRAFDTEITLFGESAVSLNDESAGGQSLSLTNSEVVSDVSDIAAIGSFETIFFTGFPGTEAGSYGLSMDADALAPIPEPTTALFGIALVALCAAARRRVPVKA